MKLKPAHLHAPPFTSTPVDRLKVGVEAGVGSRSLKARLLLTEVQSPSLGRPSAPPHHQYNPRTLSLRLYSHEAQAGTPSRAPSAPRPIATAGSGVRDERLNDPDGFREGGTAFATAMDDLNPDDQSRVLSLIHI